MIWMDTRFQFIGGRPNERYVGWDNAIGRNKYDDVESIAWAWILKENKEEDKVKINENGHMEIKIY